MCSCTGTSFSALPIKKSSFFHCFYGAILDWYRESLVALGGESYSPSRGRKVNYVSKDFVLKRLINRTRVWTEFGWLSIRFIGGVF